MEVLVVGVGDAFSHKHWGTSFLVRTGAGKLLAVDCPDSYFRALHTSGHGVSVDDLDGLFLTHLHGDHVNGLEMTLAWRLFVTKRKLHLYTTPEVAQILWPSRLQASIGTMFDGTNYNAMTLEDFADVTVVDWNTPTDILGLSIETRRTIHHIPTAALLFREGDACFGHSCDTAFDPSLLEWLEPTSLFFHEANFGPAHTPIATLNDLPEATRERMRVVHYSDVVDPGAFPGLTFAREGDHYTVR